MKKVKLTDKKIMMIMYLLFAMGAVFYGIHLCIPLVLDEVGTIANTAFMVGDDWSICVQSMGGFYYKYGQSALYVPIYLLFKNNPFLMYKVIMAFHMICISFVPVIAYYICRKYLKVESKKISILIALAGAGIPSMWLYSLYARGDMMMNFLPWVLALLLLELSETAEGKTTKKTVLSLLLGFTSVYAYMAHSRGIVLLIATVLTIVIAKILYRKDIVNYFLYVPVTAVLLVIDKFVSAYIKNGVYGIYGTKHASIENFDFETFLKIFTPKGMIIEIKLFIGWIFNLFASSYGLVLLGFIAGVVILVRSIKAKKGTEREIYVVFTLLCVLGTFFMGALFFFPHAWELMTGIKVDRADRMIYGRYTVGAVTPVCTLAVYALICKSEKLLKIRSKVFSLAAYLLVLIVFTLKVCPSLANVPSTNSRYFISLTGFLNIVKSRTNAAFPDLVEALFKAGALAFVVMLLIVLFTELNKKKAELAACIVIICFSFFNFNNVFFSVRNDRDDVVAKRVKKIVEFAGEIQGIDKISEEYPAMFKSETATLVKFYQFIMPEFNVGKLAYIRDSGQKEFLIVCGKDNIQEAISECSRLYEQDNYYMFEAFDYEKANPDVLIVKGDNLKDMLEAEGNKMIKIN